MTELERLKKKRDEIIKEIERLEYEEINIGVAQLIRDERDCNKNKLWRLRILTNLWHYKGHSDKERMQTIVIADNTQDIRGIAMSIIDDLTELVKEVDRRD